VRLIGIIFAILILGVTAWDLWVSRALTQPMAPLSGEYVQSDHGFPQAPREVQMAGVSLLHSATIARSSNRRQHETNPDLANPIHVDCLSQWSARVATLPLIMGTQAPPPPVFCPLLN
jgi:hypothetical protein